MWRVAQVGWTAALATFSPTSRFGSRRSCAQATESRTSSWASRSAFSSLSTPSPGSVTPWVQEAASITIGSAPSPLHSQSRSTISFALWRWASPNPFELHGSPQQLPATSSGIQTGSPARAETCHQRLDRVPAEDAIRAARHVDGRPRFEQEGVPLSRHSPLLSGEGHPLLPIPLLSGGGHPLLPTGGPRQTTPTLGPAHQRPTHTQRQSRSSLDRSPALRRRQRRAFGPRRVPLLAQLLDQLAGVDPDRAGELAGAVGGAGVERVVLELLEQGALDGRARRLAGHLAAQHDPLARRRGQVAAGADRLAEAALDAGRRRLLDRRSRFEVAQVDAGVAVEDDAGVEHAVGVGELLDPPHQLGRPLPPLALHIGGHVDPGAVLGLERAVVLADDQLDQLAP